MASEIKKEIKLEIGHVLFMDIVGYSKLLINEQRARRETLNQIVRGTETFREADATGTLIKSPTGDGMALVFRGSQEEPIECAIEIYRELKSYPELPLRMGVHSGPVSAVIDINDTTSVAGAGINMCQRVMDCGDAGHILISKHVAADLEQYRHWQPYLHDLGECEVKHGVRVGLVNLYSENFGNPKLPEKFRMFRRRLAGGRRIALAAGLVGVIALAGAFFFMPKRSRLLIRDKSIAVLPFENLSRDPDNAYFAVGIQDEILTRLSKIAALKVISRTSMQKYKSAPDNLREIGQELGVANLLEGNVQKAGNAVHINVQLINAVSDEHLWAESYDRELQNIFGVESEVAGAIADQLKAKLSGRELRELNARPTTNSDAYEAYLRGLAFAGGVENLYQSLRNSAEAFEKAVQLDPQFAVAWALLSRQHGLIFFNNMDHTPQRRDAARKALDMALKFGPELTETQVANACYHYFVERDYENAKSLLEGVRQQYPNNSSAAEFLGAIARRQGRWEESRQFFAQAVELDPRNTFLLADASFTDLDMRDAVAARKKLERAQVLSPKNSTIVCFLAQSFQLSGDITEAQKLLDTVEPKRGDGVYVTTAATNAILLRKYDSVLAMLKAQLEEPDALGDYFGAFENALGDVQRQAGHNAEATAAYEKTKQTVNQFLRARSEDPHFLSQLAWAEAWLGDKDAAFAHAQRAIAAMPSSKDAVLGPAYEDIFARIEAHLGEKDNAITALEHLLSIPYGNPVTAALLRIDPDFDPLRGDPRFEKLAHSDGK